MAFSQFFALSPRDCIKVMLACGLLQIAAYFFVGTWVGSGGHVAVPQPDTLLFCQSARQIAEGSPYIFSPGDKPCTGSTSHLYPFLLAALYKAGATGDLLLTAGFVLNALFYLLFLANWGWLAGRLTTSPWARITACALLALSGQAAACALAQSDVGLFMAVSSGLFVSLLAGRWGWGTVLLVVAPWCRPEGAMLAVLFLLALLIRRVVLRERLCPKEWLMAGLGVVSAAGVFVFNDWLTGTAQFQSVYAKGYFRQYDFFPAVQLVISDAVRMARELLLGEPEAMPREVFFIPLLGALFGWLGVLTRAWRREEAWKELWWVAAGLGGLAVVATSSWQNINIDRYLAWSLPIWLVYGAEGAVWVSRRLNDTVARALPLMAVVGFQAVGSVALLTLFHSTCVVSQQKYDFAKEVQTLLPSGASVGGESALSAYAMPGRRMVHLSGIYSPELLTVEPLLNWERLKHHPEWRFDFLEITPDQTAFRNADLHSLYGTVEALSVDGTTLRRMAWGAIDNACSLQVGDKPGTSQGWRLHDRLDVGYPEDEARCRYRVYNRYNGVQCEPFGCSGFEGTNEVFDVGRIVLGGDSMTLHVRPYCSVRVVLRTAKEAETTVRWGIFKMRKTFMFNTPLKISARVDDIDVGTFSLPLSTNTAAFSEVQFTLPPESIRKETPRLTVYGDRIVLAYWFYQPVP